MIEKKQISEVCLVSAVPSRRELVRAFFEDSMPGGFAEECRLSQRKRTDLDALVDGYMNGIPSILDEVGDVFKPLGFTLIRDAHSGDLKEALAHFPVVAILAHNLDQSKSPIVRLEFPDRELGYEDVARFAPTEPETVVHLGVCRSEPLIGAFKARTNSVRVIANKLTIDPEFFLRLVMRTAVLMRETKMSYIEAQSRIRLAMVQSA